MSSIKLGLEVDPGKNNVRTADIEDAVKELVVSLLFLLRCFGCSGISVTITRGDGDE